MCRGMMSLWVTWMGLNMNYIVLDLEWNQSPGGKEKENPNLGFEIIEIGAVKLNEDFEQTDEYHQYIKPLVYKSLNAHTKEILSVTMETLKKEGRLFKICAPEFLKWCGEDSIFCTWGTMDLSEFQKNMKYYHMEPMADGPIKYYDIQKLFALAYETDTKVRRSLECAVDYLGIPKYAPFHGALEDASYTSKVLRELRNKPVLGFYSYDTYVRPANRKSEIYDVFDGYAKYISREFSSKEDAMSNRDVTATKCYKCGKTAHKKIRWFSSNQKNYFCLCYCNEHGYMKGKIRLKKTETSNIFVVRTLKLVSEEQSLEVKARQEELRRRRRERRRKAAFEAAEKVMKK